MASLIKKIKNNRELMSLIKFAFCNTTAWLVDLGIFTLCYNGFSLFYILSKAFSYTAGAIASYSLNRKITFKSTTNFVSLTLLKFLAVNCVSICLSLGSMYLFSDILGIPVWISYFLSIVFSFSTNYCGNRFWVFRGITKG